MVSKPSIFKYKTFKGPLHKVPAIIKIICFFPLSVFCITLPSIWLCAGIGVLILAAFICRLTLLDQLTDLKPVLLYAIFLYLLSVLSTLIEVTAPLHIPHSSFLIPNSTFLIILTPRNDYLQITLRLILIVQISALFFRTTSSLEIRKVVKLNVITLFLMFIPEIFNTWTNINLAWKARAGRQGIVKMKTLLFVLISLSFEKAAVKSKALESRSKNYDVQ